MQKIKLDCDACGAPMQDAGRAGFYRCPYCGRSYFIEGYSSLKPDQQIKRPRGAASQPPNIPPAPRMTPAGEELIGEIEVLLSKGNKIQAIKLYRDETGAGLKEAKDFVENIEKRRPL